MGDTYLICDHIGENGYSIFKDQTIEVSSTPFPIKGFSVYVLSRYLDCPSYPFYSVLHKSNETKVSYVIPIKFLGPPPDFTTLGFDTTPTEKGIVIHVTTSHFNRLDLHYICIRVTEGNYFRYKDFYRQFGELYHLGVLHDFSSIDCHNEQNIDSLTNILHQEYGTYGSLTEALKTTFHRIYFAIHFFNIESAVATCARYRLKEHPSFGALVPSLRGSTELDLIKKFVIFSNKTLNDSPFFILINYLRTVFMGIRHLDNSIKDMDDEESLKKFIHEFQKENDLHEGNCDIKTATKIIESLQMTKYEPYPIFTMAGIDVSLYTEVDFPGLIPVSSANNDFNTHQLTPLEQIIKNEMNQSIASTPDPKMKINWMREKINNAHILYSNRSAELSDRIGSIEDRIARLADRMNKIMEESHKALKTAEEATKSLNSVYTSHVKIQNKFDKYTNSLTGEQRNTRIILVLGLFFVFVGIFKFFFL